MTINIKLSNHTLKALIIIPYITNNTAPIALTALICTGSLKTKDSRTIMVATIPITSIAISVPFRNETVFLYRFYRKMTVA